MSTVTATGWSGLVNDVHSTTYETVGEKLPQGGCTAREMQKRGNYSLSKKTGASIQLSRTVIDADQGDMTVPGEDGGAGVVITNVLGGVRTSALVNTVPATDTTGETQAFATTINHGYAADSSGNGGPALAKGTPNAIAP